MSHIQDLISKKNKENLELQAKIDRNKVYIEALNEASGVPHRRRPAQGTKIARAQQIIIDAGRPLHANEVLKALGEKKTLRNKVSIATSMAHYAASGKMFKRVAPNTFDVERTIN